MANIAETVTSAIAVVGDTLAPKARADAIIKRHVKKRHGGHAEAALQSVLPMLPPEKKAALSEFFLEYMQQHTVLPVGITVESLNELGIHPLSFPLPGKDNRALLKEITRVVETSGAIFTEEGLESFAQVAETAATRYDTPLMEYLPARVRGLVCAESIIDPGNRKQMEGVIGNGGTIHFHWAAGQTFHTSGMVYNILVEIAPHAGLNDGASHHLSLRASLKLDGDGGVIEMLPVVSDDSYGIMSSVGTDCGIGWRNSTLLYDECYKQHLVETGGPDEAAPDDYSNLSAL